MSRSIKLENNTNVKSIIATICDEGFISFQITHLNDVKFVGDDVHAKRWLNELNHVKETHGYEIIFRGFPKSADCIIVKKIESNLIFTYHFYLGSDVQIGHINMNDLCNFIEEKPRPTFADNLSPFMTCLLRLTFC